MKKRIIMASTVVALVALVIAGGTMAWFTSNPAQVVNSFTAGTVDIKINENGFQNITNWNPGDITTKDVDITVDSTKKTYVRVKLDPSWWYHHGGCGNVGFAAASADSEEQFTDDSVDQSSQSLVLAERKPVPVPIPLPGNQFAKYVKLHFVNPENWVINDKTTVKDIADKDGWVNASDINLNGYIYYKHIVSSEDKSIDVIDKVNFDGNVTNAYQGKTFKVGVKAEGVQASHDAYKSVWGLNNLPAGVEAFTTE